MQLRCHLCSAPSFRTSFHFPQKKKRKGVKDLVSEHHTGRFLNSQLSPGLVYSSHLISKAPSTPSPVCLSFTPAPLSPIPLYLFSLPKITCFPPLWRGGVGGFVGGFLTASLTAVPRLQPSPSCGPPLTQRVLLAFTALQPRYEMMKGGRR